MINNILVIDAHCHIYPEKIALRAISGTDEFYHLSSVYNGTTADLIKNATAAGVDKLIVQSVATTPTQVKSINEFISRSVAESSGRFMGLGTLHPDSEDIKGDIEHILSLGLKGIKLHPDIQKFKADSKRCFEIYEQAESHDLPILLHTGDSRYDYSNPNRILPILKTFKKLKVLGAHMGGWSVWEEAVSKLSNFDNFYVDTSSCFAFVSLDKMREYIKTYGAEKVLFASDYPMWNYESELKSFFDLGLDEQEIECILNLNAKKLFDLE